MTWLILTGLGAVVVLTMGVVGLTRRVAHEYRDDLQPGSGLYHPAGWRRRGLFGRWLPPPGRSRWWHARRRKSRAERRAGRRRRRLQDIEVQILEAAEHGDLDERVIRRALWRAAGIRNARMRRARRAG